MRCKYCDTLIRLSNYAGYHRWHDYTHSFPQFCSNSNQLHEPDIRFNLRAARNTIIGRCGIIDPTSLDDILQEFADSLFEVEKE